jgi:hypothetical protein
MLKYSDVYYKAKEWCYQYTLISADDNWVAVLTIVKYKISNSKSFIYIYKYIYIERGQECFITGRSTGCATAVVCSHWMLTDIKTVLHVNALSCYMETECAFKCLFCFNILVLFVIPVDCAKQSCE